MRILFTGFGLFFTILGMIGVALPVLPTVPFLLVALACFTRGSERFHEWFLKTKLYQKHLKDFSEKRSMPLKTKVLLLIFSSVMLGFAIYHTPFLWLKGLLVILILMKYYYFIFKIKNS